MKLHILGSAHARPTAARVIFCDGGVDESYRPGVDLELSHWIPNVTPSAFKADTSTETCLRFLDAGAPGRFDLAVNNHLDVDGVLSTFVLLHPELARQHRAVLVQAAEIGDFWGWGGVQAQLLFQALALLMADSSGEDVQQVYHRCFERARTVLAGEIPPTALAGIEALARAVDRIDRGEILRTVMGPRFVGYVIPHGLAAAHSAAALHVPAFNAPLSGAALLPPHARARDDGQRVQLVSVETAGGWFHDLWYPGYAWAETPGRWPAPGLSSLGSSNVHRLDHAPLTAAAAALQARESGAGQWVLATELSPFASIAGRNFPVVLTFLGEPSALSPDTVAALLAPAFAETMS